MNYYIQHIKNKRNIKIFKGWNVCLANGHEIDKMKDAIYKFIET